MHISPYIDHSINITEALPYNLQYIIDEMEEYDKTGSVLYFSSMDDFVDAVKNSYVAGNISAITKHALEKKYFYHANEVAQMEDKET